VNVHAAKKEGLNLLLMLQWDAGTAPQAKSFSSARQLPVRVALNAWYPTLFLWL